MERRQGYEITRIDEGPNSRLYYVLSSDFKLLTASRIRLGLYVDWVSSNVTPADELARCRALPGNAGLSATMNWYQYNTRCRGVNAAAIITALYDHERRHHDRATAIASTLDPRAAIEALVGLDDDVLHTLVRDRVVTLNAAAYAAMQGTQEPTVGSHTFWMYIVDRWVVGTFAI